jgi:DNA-binding MarR family transcriptional regulator
MLDPPVTAVLRSLAALELAALRHRGRVRRRLNLGEEELSALLQLAHHGEVTQGRLQELTTLSRSGAGAMIGRLEQDGFVERRTDPADRRVRHVSLSESGRERLCGAYGDLTSAAGALLADRGEDELERLGALLDALAAAHGGDDASEPLPAPAPSEPIWRRWG